MAIDTQSKRMAARDVGFPFWGPTVNASGTISLTERAQITGNYIYAQATSGYNSGNELLLLFTGILRTMIP